MKLRTVAKCGAAVLAAVTAFALTACSEQDAGKDKIFLNLSYSGNNWQDEAANLALAVANSPLNSGKYLVKKQISGTDIQKQISDLQSMIAAKAKLVVLYPISPTALSPTIRQGCDRGVTFVVYDSTVREPCAYNVAFITGAKADQPRDAFFGAQTAEALAQLLGGKGRIFMNRGVPGTSTDQVHYDTAKAVFDRYPGITVVAEYYGKWDSAVSQQETAKALAAHPDIDGIWSQDGEVGVIKALQAAGKKVPVTGENGNYFRKMLSEGWPGVSSGSPPAQAGVAMRIGLRILEHGPDSVPHDIEMPLPWVTTETAKPCPGNEFVDGCNFFPNESDTLVTEIFQKDLLPQSSLAAARTGAPMAELTPLGDVSAFAQPEWRRVFTRGKCDAGWREGTVDDQQNPAGLPGCVQEQE
ncbi:ribose transport system substrate-binding protein [Mycobacterium frederiksbergense]|uniref:Ribose transport system substrate-binding protein n=1 Tax=Mycolicibacterium frederiksbergense TaxID=117567 RepID=A0ABT6L152_9MYCO|nr:sugar ABC transporter substrate-binding protein [Mycolicibacterium frederiksbergense]MDH6196671.1 ribose transport system substrate-binding protein [Mycolicibacterium frederiksbergense]